MDELYRITDLSGKVDETMIIKQILCIGSHLFK